MDYVHVKVGVVDNKTMFAGTIPPTWPDHESWYQHDTAQIGWLYDGTTFSPPAPPSYKMTSQVLSEAISDVCPIVSVSVVDGTNRSTWTYVPKLEATAQQKADADTVIATIPIAPPKTVTSTDFIGRWTNAEWRTVTSPTWRQTGGNAKNLDVVIFDPVIKLGKKKVTTLKTSLVTDGTLTQARADVIFS